MATFKDIFNDIAEAIKDMAELEVVTYKGTINIGGGALPANLDAVLANAKAQADFKIVANTKAMLDGDTLFFRDAGATDGEIAAHNQLVENATAKRHAIVQLFQTAITNAIK